MPGAPALCLAKFEAESEARDRSWRPRSHRSPGSADFPEFARDAAVLVVAGRPPKGKDVPRDLGRDVRREKPRKRLMGFCASEDREHAEVHESRAWFDEISAPRASGSFDVGEDARR